MRVKYTTMACGGCEGTGEICEFPGGDGYPPMMQKCDVCKGTGVYHGADYTEDSTEDHIYHVVSL